MTFALHPQLEKDTFPIGDLPLCRVLLMNNKNFPWLILVPRRLNKRELFDLEADDYHMLMEEIRVTAHAFSEFTGAHKINVAALGNMVPQLHIHIIARFEHDIVWPQPVWSCSTSAVAYPRAEAGTVAKNIRDALNITKM